MGTHSSSSNPPKGSSSDSYCFMHSCILTMFAFRSKLTSIPEFSETIIAVVLSLFTLAFTASNTRCRATSLGSCSINSLSTNFALAISAHSLLENLSNKPSDARRMKSSFYLLKVVTRISGSQSTKFRSSCSPVYSFLIGICLHSKSPKALVTASRPSTRPKTM